MLLFNNAGKLWLGERDGEPGHWQFPQGGVDEGDSLEDTVVRELGEEVGLAADKVRIAKKLRATFDYDWPEVRSYGKKKYRGQSQTFWLVEFLGEDNDINVATDHKEFMNWKWCSSAEVRTIASKVRLPGYLMPLREFEDYLLLRDTGLLE